VAWHTNNTVNGNEEVFFRATNDGGKTFGDIVYLSHTVISNSTRIEIDSDVDIVAVQWWESNKTDDIPAMRISNDYGETFGPTLKLSKTGTIDEEGGYMNQDCGRQLDCRNRDTARKCHNDHSCTLGRWKDRRGIPIQ